MSNNYKRKSGVNTNQNNTTTNQNHTNTNKNNTNPNKKSKNNKQSNNQNRDKIANHSKTTNNTNISSTNDINMNENNSDSNNNSNDIMMNEESNMYLSKNLYMVASKYVPLKNAARRERVSLSSRKTAKLEMEWLIECTNEQMWHIVKHNQHQFPLIASKMFIFPYIARFKDLSPSDLQAFVASYRQAFPEHGPVWDKVRYDAERKFELESGWLKTGFAQNATFTYLECWAPRSSKFRDAVYSSVIEFQIVEFCNPEQKTEVEKLCKVEIAKKIGKFGRAEEVCKDKSKIDKSNIGNKFKFGEKFIARVVKFKTSFNHDAEYFSLYAGYLGFNDELGLTTLNDSVKCGELCTFQYIPRRDKWVMRDRNIFAGLPYQEYFDDLLYKSGFDWNSKYISIHLKHFCTSIECQFNGDCEENEDSDVETFSSDSISSNSSDSISSNSSNSISSNSIPSDSITDNSNNIALVLVSDYTWAAKNSSFTGSPKLQRNMFGNDIFGFCAVTQSSQNTNIYRWILSGLCYLSFLQRQSLKYLLTPYHLRYQVLRLQSLGYDLYDCILVPGMLDLIASYC